MGRQINFFLHDDDQPQFEQIIKSCGDVLFIPHCHNQDIISTLNTSVIIDRERYGNTLHLVRPVDFNKIELRYIDKLNHWIIDHKGKYPIVDFERSIKFDNHISRGRLFFKTSFGQDDNLIKKNDDFVKWGNSLIRKFRKNLIKHRITDNNRFYDLYVGEKALEWIMTNDITVGPGAAILKIKI